MNQNPYDITVNRLPGSWTGAVAYNWRTGKISVSDNGRSMHLSIVTAVDGLRDVSLFHSQRKDSMMVKDTPFLQSCPFCGDQMKIDKSEMAVHINPGDCFIGTLGFPADSPAHLARWNTRSVLTPQPQRR